MFVEHSEHQYLHSPHRQSMSFHAFHTRTRIVNQCHSMPSTPQPASSINVIPCLLHQNPECLSHGLRLKSRDPKGLRDIHRIPHEQLFHQRRRTLHRAHRMNGWNVVGVNTHNHEHLQPEFPVMRPVPQHHSRQQRIHLQIHRFIPPDFHLPHLNPSSDTLRNRFGWEVKPTSWRLNQDFQCLLTLERDDHRQRQDLRAFLGSASFFPSTEGVQNECHRCRCNYLDDRPHLDRCRFR